MVIEPRDIIMILVNKEVLLSMSQQSMLYSLIGPIPMEILNIFVDKHVKMTQYSIYGRFDFSVYLSLGLLLTIYRNIGKSMSIGNDSKMSL